MVALSIAWSPKLSKLQMYTECPETTKREMGTERQPLSVREENTSRNRMTMITSTFKIIFTILFAFGLNLWVPVTNTGNPLECLRNGFEHFNDYTTMVYEFYFQVCWTWEVKVDLWYWQYICGSMTVEKYGSVKISLSLVKSKIKSICQNRNVWRLFEACSWSPRRLLHTFICTCFLYNCFRHLQASPKMLQ